MSKHPPRAEINNQLHKDEQNTTNYIIINNMGCFITILLMMPAGDTGGVIIKIKSISQ